MPSPTIDDLRKVFAFSELPDDHLQWILDRATFEEHEDGGQLISTGQPMETMLIIMEGQVDFYMDVKGKLVYYVSFTNNPTTGGMGGLLPYSRMKVSPGFAYAKGPVRIGRLHKKYFPELEQLNPELIQKLIGYMTERARTFATTQLQHEKVNALGKLAAGIAHELNNPAAAINRIANELGKRLNRNYAFTENLLKCNINPQQIQSIRAMVLEKESAPKARMSTMQRMENEDEISAWLEDNGAENREAAETFSEHGFSTSELEKIKSDVGKEAFGCVLPWLENLLSSQKISKDLDDASSRISHLVDAIKSHVHMDRTNDLQTTNIHNDIENTLILLGFKLREKNIEVKKIFCNDMTVVPAYVGELNQVWTNLIDNAIYALPKNGELTIKTACDKKNIKVFVIDNGSGIPKDIVNRIFDPFFTTKKVGEGTGIGLDTVNRIIKRHNGEIKVNSEPGRTEFEVCIPVVQ